MDAAPSRIESILHAVHGRLLWLLVGCYVLGALVPGPALALRHASLGRIAAGSDTLELTAPTLLLAFLLFHAGMGARASELRHVARRPAMIALGLLANTLIPVLYALVVVGLLSAWPEPEETQHILVGLAMIAAMPIAGASTAWSQSTDGNLALSLGLVLASTLLSPLLTPVVLRAIAGLATGDYAEDLGELAEGGTQLFLIAAVVVPSVLGIAVRRALPPALWSRIAPAAKLTNLAVLLILNYANAALALPAIVRSPDLDFLALVAAIVALLCAIAFAAGAWIARVSGGSRADQSSLMFGLGMSNNGTGLVLATSAMADHPAVVVPILFYNLVQQIAAGLVARRRRAEA